MIKLIAQNGRGVNLLKGSSKRKRTKAELEDVKQEEEELKENRQEFLKEYRRLKEEVSILHERVEIMSNGAPRQNEDEGSAFADGQQQLFNI